MNFKRILPVAGLILLCTGCGSKQFTAATTHYDTNYSEETTELESSIESEDEYVSPDVDDDDFWDEAFESAPNVAKPSLSSSAGPNDIVITMKTNDLAEIDLAELDKDVTYRYQLEDGGDEYIGFEYHIVNTGNRPYIYETDIKGREVFGTVQQLDWLSSGHVANWIKIRCSEVPEGKTIKDYEGMVDPVSGMKVGVTYPCPSGQYFYNDTDEQQVIHAYYKDSTFADRMIYLEPGESIYIANMLGEYELLGY